MSAKEAKPTLAGVTVKTRKRDIVAPTDPGSFADAIITVIEDSSDGVNLDSDLEAAAKALDSSDLEYSKYGETLFEVLFTGGRVVSGSTLAEEGKKLDKNILASPGTRESILPYVKVFQLLGRRRPYLYNRLEKTLIKLLLSLEFFTPEHRDKLAIALALVFSLKLNVLPENIFSALLNDRLVAKGTVLDVMTTFLQEYLAKDSIDDLVAILGKGKVVNRLTDFFPPSKRSPEDFNQWFQEKGLDTLVEWNKKRQQDIKVQELLDSLVELISADPPAPASEVLSLAKAKKAENDLPESEVLRVSWLALTKSINLTGKNQQQIAQAILRQVKAYNSLFTEFATSKKNELALLVTIQVLCYEDTRLLKVFTDIVRILYDSEVVGEDAIMLWYKKGSHPKGRNVFLKDVEPFIKWLEEAEEEEDD